MKIERLSMLLSTLLLLGTTAVGQVFPVTAHVQINSPTTTYLTEFTQLGSDRLSVNLFMNDFSVPSYDIRLKMSIEGNGISMVTHPNYIPPITTIFPGANLFSGGDLSTYLSTRNMLINGIAAKDLQQGGSGLPEGIYTFCVQVFDNRRPEVALTINHCSSRFLRKNYPPTKISPVCGSTIPVFSNNQDILFQWNTNADLSIQTLYELSIVEVPMGMNPNDAINGASTKILDAEPVMGTSFIYGANQLPLEIGKKYAYRVKASDLQGNTSFENKGVSQVCSFYYGVNSNGMVPLSSPALDQLVSVSKQLTFQWDRPANARPDQQVYYKLKVVKVLPDQAPEMALKFNPIWYEVETPVLPANSAEVLPASLYPLPDEELYVWEVKAYSDNNGTEQEVAISEKRTFISAPAVERFKAGNPDPNIITVLTLTKNEDADNGEKLISGVGRMQIRENGEEVELNFEDIVVGPYRDFWQLERGIIVEPLKDFIVRLDNSGNPSGDPGNMNNYGQADFFASHVIVEKDDLKLQGRVKWKFPHPVVGGSPVVQSLDLPILYNRYKLLDAYVGVETKSFDLLDPYGFKITYYASAAPETEGGSHTIFSVVDDVLTLTLDGEIAMPAKVVDLSGNRIVYKFQDADNPFYFTQLGMEADPDIRLVKNTKIQLDAVAAIFDLSEDQSPEKIADNTWKGIYFDDFNFLFPIEFDGGKQIVLMQEQAYNFKALPGNNFYAWIDRAGLDCNVNQKFTGGTGPAAAFNTFKDNIREIQMKLEDNAVSDCFIKGFVYVPLLDPDEEFAYNIPFDNNGLQTSFLEDDLVDRVVTIRANSNELRLKMTVRQAVFKDNERLDLVIDLDWEALQVYIPNLTQFKIWGDGEVGFNVPGGARGITNVKGLFNNTYDMTVDSVAAGFFGGTYAFNLISTIILSDEKVAMSDAGSTSPPRARFYTDEERVPPSGHGPPQMLVTTNYLGASHWTRYNNGTKEELKKGKIVMFIPFMIYIPISPSSLAVTGGAVLAGTGLGAALGAGVGASIAAITEKNPRAPETGAGQGAGIGAGAGAGIAASAYNAYSAANSVAWVMGVLTFVEDDPDWGDVFTGLVYVGIEKPTSFGINGTVIIGKKDDIYYGLVELKYMANSIDYYSTSRLGSPVPRYTAGLTSPHKLDASSQKLPAFGGKYNVVEIGGRVYWNMSHSVEDECGADFTSNIRLGGIEGEAGASVSMAKIPLTGQFTNTQIVNAMPDANLAQMLCDIRTGNPTNFMTILNGLPPPDFQFLASAVPEIPRSTWNTLQAANVNSYSHLVLLFPDDLCPRIVEAMVKDAKAGWKARHHTFGTAPGWGEHLDALKYKPTFGVFYKMSTYFKEKTLKAIQVSKPATREFFVNEGILTETEWPNVSYPTPKTWLSIYKEFPSKKWGQIIPSLINLQWPVIWQAVDLPDNPKADLAGYIDKYQNSAFDELKLKFPAEALFLENSLQGDVAGAMMSGLTALAKVNYKVDNSIDFGMMLSMRMENTIPFFNQFDGMLEMYKGTIEMSGGQGSFGQLLIRVDAGWGNRPHPADTEGSVIKGKGCITYTEKTKTFIATIQGVARAGVGGVCGQGMLHIESSPNEFHLQLGTKDFPINVIYPCLSTNIGGQKLAGEAAGGVGSLGWFEIHDEPGKKVEVEAALGMSLNAFVSSERFGAEACSIYGFANAFAAFAVFARVQLDPVEILKAGVLLGMGMDVGVSFSGPFCPFGDINALHVYAGGEAIFDFPKGTLNGNLGAEATLFGWVSARFKFVLNEVKI